MKLRIRQTGRVRRGAALANASGADVLRESSSTGTGFGTASASSALTVSATDRVLGRSSAGAGVVEEITCTAAGRALLDDANAAAQLATLGVTTNGTAAVGQLPGTTTNDAAAAGKVGEYGESIVLSGSAVALTTAVAADVTSISLTAGDWDVSANISFTGGVTTTVDSVRGSISTTSGVMATSPARRSVVIPAGATVFNFQNLANWIGPVRISLAATTTVYLVAAAAFAVSTCSAFGALLARRVR